MKIVKNIWQRVVYGLPSDCKESGGLLGGRENIVSCCVFDAGMKGLTERDIYTPDTAFLNSMINEWYRQGIEFYGFFHSHISENERLSNGDIHYINRIMKLRLESSGPLYFPIIRPKEKMIVYRADKDGDKVRIVSEGIELL